MESNAKENIRTWTENDVYGCDHVKIGEIMARAVTSATKEAIFKQEGII